MAIQVHNPSASSPELLTAKEARHQFPEGTIFESINNQYYYYIFLAAGDVLVVHKFDQFVYPACCRFAEDERIYFRAPSGAQITFSN